jgi:hypothetical protein
LQVVADLPKALERSCSNFSLVIFCCSLNIFQVWQASWK